MITVITGHWEFDGDGRARVVFVFQESTGIGIRSVAIFDRAGVPILPIVQPVMCPTSHQFLTPWLPRTRFPLYAEAEDCAGATTTRDNFGPLYEHVATPDHDSVRTCSPLLCPPSETRACSDASREAFDAASALEPICEECANLERLREEHHLINNVAWGTFWAATTLAIILFTQLPWPANVIAGCIASAVAIAALAIAFWALGEELRFARELEACRTRMEPIRTAFANASATMRAECCCYVIPIPSC